MIDWKILPIEQIKPNPDNPRYITKEAFKKLVKSIREFPEMLGLRPLVIDENNMVLGGNMRLKACEELGIKEIPVIKAELLTPEQCERFIIVDNLPFGQWDYDILHNEWNFDTLKDWGFDFAGFEEPQETDEEAIPYESKNIIKLQFSDGEYSKIMLFFDTMSGSKERIIYNLIFPNE